MKLNKILFVVLAITLISSAIFPILVLAQDNGLQGEIQGGLTNLGTGAGFKTSAETGGLPALVGKIINVFISILGVLFVVLMVYGGYLWMTSFGNSQKVDRAKELIIDAVIGLIIILLAYAIANFIVGELVKTTTT